MLSFNTLLYSEGLDPKVIKLVRHQDIRWQTLTISGARIGLKQQKRVKP